MSGFTFIWKIIGGDVHEQEYRGYEHEVDAVDDWMENHRIQMDELEWMEIKEK